MGVGNHVLVMVRCHFMFYIGLLTRSVGSTGVLSDHEQGVVCLDPKSILRTHPPSSQNLPSLDFIRSNFVEENV
jgi:hypothetical protein